MALNSRVGSFALNTTVGSQSVTGLGFTPKAVIFYGSRLEASGGNIGHFFHGVAAASNQQWATAHNAQAATNKAFSGMKTDGCILELHFSTGAVNARAALTGFTADGFTLNIDTTDAVARTIHYLAIGGDDVTAKAGTILSPAVGAAAGNQAYAGLVSFAPKAVLFSLANFTTGEAPDFADPHVSLGVGTVSNRAVLEVDQVDAGTLRNNSTVLIDNAIVVAYNNSTPGLTGKADLVSIDESGWTLNWQTVPAAQTKVGYLALGGIAQFKVGTFYSPTTASTTQVSVVGFAPQAVLLMSSMKARNIGATAHATFALGAASSPTQRGSIAYHIDNNTNSATQPRVASDSSRALTMIDNAGTVITSAELSAFNSEGFQLNYPSVNGVAHEGIYFAVAGAAGVSASGTTGQGQGVSVVGSIVDSLVVADRVKQASTTTGTGNLALAGALPAFRTFADVMQAGQSCYYTIVAVDGAGVPTGDWETGFGTYVSANTLERTVPLASSSSNQAVNFAAGTKHVWIDLNAYQVRQISTTQPVPPLKATGATGQGQTAALASLADIAASGATAQGESISASGTIAASNTITPFDPNNILAGKAGWTLVFQDEFNGNSLDTDKWTSSNFYTTTQQPAPPDNSDWNVENSCLNMWPVFRQSMLDQGLGKNGFVDRTFITRPHPVGDSRNFRPTYGYFEMRAKLPRGKGVWPAFWTLGVDNGNDPNWNNEPYRPEIDFMEAYGGEQATYWSTGEPNYNLIEYAGTIHWRNGDPGRVGDRKPGRDIGYSPGNYSSEFHIFACKWELDKITFYVDNRYVGEFDTSAYRSYFSQPQYLFLDLWYGSAAGLPDPARLDLTPQGPTNAYSIDYVRVWRLS